MVPAARNRSSGSNLAGTHKVLFSDIDGTFPNHHPNPVDPETLDLLRTEVASLNADLGHRI